MPFSDRAGEAILRALKFRAGLAQSVEHIIRNDGVRCSNHLSGTILYSSPAYSKSLLRNSSCSSKLMTR